MYRSRNPALSDSTFDKSAYSDAPWWDDQDSNMMTMEGTAEKTGILLILIATTAIATAMFMPASAPLVFLGAITGFILALVIIFTGSTNPVLISTYAILQGLVLGGITWIYEIYFPGIGILAVVLTLAILGAMLVIYRAGLISWSKNLQIAVYSSLSAIVLIYLVDIIGLFLGFRVPVIHEASPLGILFSLFVVGIASLCLVADFDFIERGVERGAPKQLECRAAFGLMVTLIWLYLEILELLAKLAAVSKRKCRGACMTDPLQLDLILGLAFAGATLGIVEGIKPGPLLTMVIRETLSGGLRAGLWTAAAPIFTDGPLVIFSLFAAAWLAEDQTLLFLVTAAGAAFLAWMGIQCFYLEPPDINADAPPPTGSFLRGVITNLLNPNVYVFWFLIGGPLMASAIEETIIAPIAYAVTFLVTIMLTKAAIAYAVHRAGGSISPVAYRRLLAFCGVAMLLFSASYAWDAYNMEEVWNTL